MHTSTWLSMYGNVVKLIVLDIPDHSEASSKGDFIDLCLIVGITIVGPIIVV